MGRTFISGLAAFAAFALATPAAQARDEKSTARGASNNFLREEAQAVSLRQDSTPGSAAVLTRRGPGGDPFATESDATALVRERRKPLTLFRFNTQLGEVAVQPVFGRAKGAQLSFGF